MHKTFETPGPISLYAEVGSGSVTVLAEPVASTVVEVDGPDAEDTVVEQRGDDVVVVTPKRRTGFFGGSPDYRVRVTFPLDSRLATKLGSADLSVSGRIGEARLRSGSGDVEVEEVAGSALIETGSGDVEVHRTGGDLRVKTGSGDLELDRAGGEVSVTTGSGDVEIGLAQHAVAVKSGSGDLRVAEAYGDVALATASGDLVVDTMHHGALVAKNASGDIHVGIPAGIPVWTDVQTVTGSVDSTLSGAGRPEEGQDYIEVRAKTVSGDIRLQEL